MKTTHQQPMRYESESEAVVEWRREQLCASGFDAELARHLAVQSGADLHALIELVERGCPAPLAARILAPLEDEPVRTSAGRTLNQ
jgi:hypothetical protein